MSQEADLLRELIAEIRALPGALAAALQTSARGPLRARELDESQHASLVRLVAGISQALGNRAFNVRELVEHARFDARLKAVLDAECGSDSRKLGKRLQKAQALALHEYSVERVKTERAGAMWRIVTISRVSLPQHSRPVA